MLSAALRKPGNFSLVLTKDPPACEIVRGDQILKRNGNDVTIRVLKNKTDWEEVEGVILTTGLKRDLESIYIDKDGNEIQDKEARLLNRKREVEKARLEQVRAQKLHLQSVASDILEKGSDAVCDEVLQPVIKKKKLCLPTDRGTALKDALRSKLKDMPCFRPGPGKTVLPHPEQDLYINSGKFAYARLKYRLNPEGLHRAMLKMLIPQEILRLDGVRPTETRGCVAVPSIISEVVTLYVSSFWKSNGQDLKLLKYNPQGLLKNLIDNTRQKKGVVRLFVPPEIEENPLASTSTAVTATSTAPAESTTTAVTASISTAPASTSTAFASTSTASASISTAFASTSNDLSANDLFSGTSSPQTSSPPLPQFNLPSTPVHPSCFDHSGYSMIEPPIILDISRSTPSVEYELKFNTY